MRGIFTIDMVSAKLLSSFDCGYAMTMFCNKAKDKNLSVIPNRETSSGFTHFYKQGAVWKFVAQEDYESEKSELPDIAFAIAYPFSDFASKAQELPDLTKVLAAIGIDTQVKSHCFASTYSEE